jgi:hypothetical protein
MTGFWQQAYRGEPMVDTPPLPRPSSFKGMTDDCIIGTRIGKNGYARLPSGKRGVYLYAHRVAWENAYGEIPAGHHVHHGCGTKACVNLR